MMESGGAARCAINIEHVYIVEAEAQVSALNETDVHSAEDTVVGLTEIRSFYASSNGLNSDLFNPLRKLESHFS